MEGRKSVDSVAFQLNDPEMKQSPMRRKSLESPANATGTTVHRKKSVELMEIDRDEYFDIDNDNQHESVTAEVHISPRRLSQPLVKKSVGRTYITKEEFDYTMNLFDMKITSIYKLCKYIGDKQNENSKALKRLVALDELSEEFWSVSNLKHLAVLFDL